MFIKFKENILLEKWDRTNFYKTNSANIVNLMTLKPFYTSFVVFIKLFSFDVATFNLILIKENINLKIIKKHFKKVGITFLVKINT